MVKMVCSIARVWGVVAAAVIFCGCQSGGQVKQPAVSESVQTVPEAVSPDSAPVQQAESKRSQKPIPADAPQIKVINAEYDFGALPPDSKDNKGQFEFTNVGKTVLRIDNVQSTCGCTVPELTKKEYEPGESGVVTFTFHAPAYPGNTTKHLYIISNDPRTPRAELTIKAKVEVKVTAEPTEVSLFLNKDNAGMPEIKIKSLDNVPFAINKFTASGGGITCDFDKNEKKAEHTLSPIVDVNQLKDFTVGTMLFDVDHPQAKQVVIRFNALPMYELRPSRLVVQNAVPDVPVTREVGVVNNYGQSFEIESIQSQSGLMSVLSQKQNANTITLEIQILPAKQQGNSRRYITDNLNIKIKDGPTLTVRCSGWYKL